MGASLELGTLESWELWECSQLISRVIGSSGPWNKCYFNLSSPLADRSSRFVIAAPRARDHGTRVPAVSTVIRRERVDARRERRLEYSSDPYTQASPR